MYDVVHDQVKLLYHSTSLNAGSYSVTSSVGVTTAVVTVDECVPRHSTSPSPPSGGRLVLDRSYRGEGTIQHLVQGMVTGAFMGSCNV